MIDHPHPTARTGASGPSPTKVIAASLIGTSLEWYDFFLYITATALVFNKLFFPQFDPATGTLLGFSTAAAGFGLPRGAALEAVLIGSACQLVLIPLFGAASDRYGRRPVYALGAATVIALLAHAAMYGPQAAFISELFTTKLRYSGASMGYQIVGILGGGTAPIVSIALVQRFHTAYAVSGYVFAMLALTLIALRLAPETSGPGYLHASRPDATGVLPWAG